MKWIKGEYTVSTDKRLLDVELIHGFLQTSYWAASRTREEVEATIARSICFGLYQGERQIGFARLVTDEVVISWLGDVFVIPEYQRRGLGRWLMECVCAHPVMGKTKCLLGTRDAHGLYEKYGWARTEAMSRLRGLSEAKLAGPSTATTKPVG